MPAHLIGEGHILNLENGDEWFIGRDPDLAEFVIEDPSVSRKHARLSRQESGMFIQNLSDSKSILIKRPDGKEVLLKEKDLSEALLKEGDQVHIGSHSFLYSEEDIPLQKEGKKDAYDDIFGDLEEPTEPPPPSRQEKRQERFEPLRNEKESLEPRAESKQEDSLYETVWESDADLPYNLLQPATLMLKVISGPNAGAEIGIEKGRSYVIGRDPNSCGVLFHDYSVSNNHAKLHVSQDGVMEIEDLGSKNGVLVNGSQIDGKKEISAKDQISLGTTIFLMIDREMAQDTIYSPLVPYYEPAKIPEEETGIDEEAKATEKESEDWKNKPLPVKHLAIGGAFLSVIFVVFLTFFSLFKSNQISEPKKEPVSEIQEALAKYTDVHFSFNPASGKLFIVGHVLTGVDYQEMLYRIGEVNFVQSTENNVVIDELVRKSINDLLSNNEDWKGVSIRSTTAGKFEVVGYVQTNQQAAALSDFLTVNFPYLDRLQNDVVSEETLNTQVQGLLIQYGFGSVAYQISGNELTLSGNYSNKMNKEYTKLLKDLNKQPGISRVRNYAMPANPGAAGINISQNYQVTGSSIADGQGYSVILNGRIYEVGTYVDGMEITTIETNTILLEKDGIKYKIDYRQ
jgi:type III secretion system YscD/HrpQ family protein